LCNQHDHPAVRAFRHHSCTTKDSSACCSSVPGSHYCLTRTLQHKVEPNVFDGMLTCKSSQHQAQLQSKRSASCISYAAVHVRIASVRIKLVPTLMGNDAQSIHPKKILCFSLFFFVILIYWCAHVHVQVPAVVLVCRNSTDTAYFQRLRPYPRIMLRRMKCLFKDYDKTPIGFGVVVFCIAKSDCRQGSSSSSSSSA